MLLPIFASSDINYFVQPLGCYESLDGSFNNVVHDSPVFADAMLESAKENLRQVAFFGLLERQQDSQKLFEKIFGAGLIK